ncbi:MAG: methylenetetrahydrofolate reductase [Schwartzia sp.]|nr:methylenetetrahydrofolate reductase [Schwartzia sp. (in: firmicutes)]
MGRISVELVPRTVDGLTNQLKLVESNISRIDVINIPDLLSCELRGPEGAVETKKLFPSVIPHIRAMDIDLEKPLPMADYLRENNIKEVLVIQGDPPQDMMHTVYPTESIDVIWKFKKEMPWLKVYAGIDQYRGSMRQEQYRIRRKLQAGADGFFTQPFFDMRYLEMYADMLSGLNIYWGITPVLSERSKSYWELKNSVVFPRGFETGMDWSIDFGRKVIDFAQKNDSNVYLMPIKADFTAYVSGILAD